MTRFTSMNAIFRLRKILNFKITIHRPNEPHILDANANTVCLLCNVCARVCVCPQCTNCHQFFWFMEILLCTFRCAARYAHIMVYLLYMCVRRAPCACLCRNTNDHVHFRALPQLWFEIHVLSIIC